MPHNLKFRCDFMDNKKYVVCGDVPVTLTQLSEDSFTVDDMMLLIKKLAGISG